MVSTLVAAIVGLVAGVRLIAAFTFILPNVQEEKTQNIQPITQEPVTSNSTTWFTFHPLQCKIYPWEASWRHPIMVQWQVILEIFTVQ